MIRDLVVKSLLSSQPMTSHDPWFADVTFKTMSLLLTQSYTIHAIQRDRVQRLHVKWRLDFATRCTTGYTTGCITGCTTGCIYVYFMQPVAQPIVQSVVQPVVQPMQISQSPVNHLLRHGYMT
jgi:hypothetical protein